MIIVLSAFPDRKSADKAAKTLVEGRLAACASIIRLESSVYRWEGRVQRHPEFLLIIKTAGRAYPAVEKQIKAVHPHRVPEIVAMDVKRGSAGYLEWLESCISKKP